MKKNSYLVLTSIVVIANSIPTFAIAGLKPQLQLQHEWAHNDDIYGAGVLIPYVNNSLSVPFLDLRYYENKDNTSNTSIGLGYRRGLSDQQFIGINTYYDSLKTENNNRSQKYQQASIGFEYLNKDWQTRANYYKPLNNTANTLHETQESIIKDHYLGINSIDTIEEINDSFDIEIGRTLWQNDKHSMSMSLSNYWQNRINKNNNRGFRLKSDYTTNSLNWLPTGLSLGIGSYIAHDRENDLNGGVQLKFNYGRSDVSNHHILQQVRRELVNTPEIYTTENFEKAININGKVQEFNYNNTKANVFKVNQQIAKLGDKGVAMISGQVSFTDSLVLGKNQTLLGGGSSIPIETASGKIGNFTYNASPAIITNSNKSSSVIKVSSNSTVDSVTTKGGSEGISSVNEGTDTKTSNVSINKVDISTTAGDGIKLNNTDGLTIKNSNIHDLTICENNTNCEFSVFSPNIAPNAGISAIGSRNIGIDNLSIKNVTYGIFLASDYDKNSASYNRTTENISINNTDISNSRREGLLLVGNDGVETQNLTIDNTHQAKEMDLVVLQGSHDITMNNTNLLGGINGLMIVNSSNLPSFDNNDINVKDMTINSPSRSGVFINPASKINLENVTVNNPSTAGIALFGNDWMGGPVNNVTLKNFQVNNPSSNTLTFFGPVKNINGNIKTTQSSNVCQNQWGMGRLEQDNGYSLTINSEVLKNLNDCAK